MLTDRQNKNDDMVCQGGFLCRVRVGRISQQSFTLTDLVDFLRGIQGLEYGEFEFGEMLDIKRHRQVRLCLP